MFGFILGDFLQTHRVTLAVAAMTGETREAK
jgi:hypothetical protein